MTEIIYRKDSDKTYFTVSGHSNGPRLNGADLCCCSASTLVFTLMRSLMALNLPGYSYSYGDGMCTLSFLNKGMEICKAFIAIDTVMHGFELLHESYPNNIKISIEQNFK